MSSIIQIDYCRKFQNACGKQVALISGYAVKTELEKTKIIVNICFS